MWIDLQRSRDSWIHLSTGHSLGSCIGRIRGKADYLGHYEGVALHLLDVTDEVTEGMLNIADNTFQVGGFHF